MANGFAGSGLHMRLRPAGQARADTPPRGGGTGLLFTALAQHKNRCAAVPRTQIEAPRRCHVQGFGMALNMQDDGRQIGASGGFISGP